MAPPVKFNAVAKLTFLEALRETGLILTSAELAGVDHSTVSDHRKKDKEFEANVQLAMSLHRDMVEGEIKRRACQGVKRPIFYQGREVGSIQEFSDRMLELYAKRHIPEYRERYQVDMGITGGVLVVPGTVLDAQAWREKHNGEKK